MEKMNCFENINSTDYKGQTRADVLDGDRLAFPHSKVY